MCCVRLAELPPPPTGSTGWPWTEESSQLPATMRDGRPWPCISIVTPSLNQGQFIEETIRSVLLQGYPDLEYTIMDGGSTDNSVEIIKKYEPWIAHWESKRDRGQAHAINKGLNCSTGYWFQNINSDDVLSLGALGTVAAAPSNADAVCGSVEEFSEAGRYLVENTNITLLSLLREFC